MVESEYPSITEMATVIESALDVTLSLDGDFYYATDSRGTFRISHIEFSEAYGRVPVEYSIQSGTYDSYIIGAERINERNAVLWLTTNVDNNVTWGKYQLHVWYVDDNWVYQESSSTDFWSLDNVQQWELGFNQDINGDRIGGETFLFLGDKSRVSADSITCGSTDDQAFGFGGNDKIRGQGGEDILYGGKGSDQLFGGTDNDNLFGEAGGDIVKGDEGDDFISGGDGNDELYGGTGDDHMEGDRGNDVLYGNDGSDSIYGGEGNDKLYGGRGNDELQGQAGNDILYGEDDDDGLVGGDGNDKLYGGRGNDVLTGIKNSFDDSDLYVQYGGSQIDYLTGGLGADIFVLGDANHVFYDDADNSGGGKQGYAIITDFNYLQGDRVRLHGSFSDYVFQDTRISNVSGCGIYFGDGLVGILQGRSYSNIISSTPSDWASFVEPIA